MRRFPFTKNFEKLPWKGPSSAERVPFDTSSILSCSRQQNDTDIAVNSLELVIPRENL